MTFKEEIHLHFSEEVSIQIRHTIGEILVWDRGTGYGQPTMFDTLEKVREMVGHNDVKYISTTRKAIH